MIRRQSSSRSCGGSAPRPFLSLGETPIANSLLTEDRLAAPEPRYPLGVGFCPTCSLVQLTHELPAEVIFSADYPYFSSFSDALRRHAREHSLNLVATRGLDERSLVVEVASNDGYLLRNFVEAGVPALGIEPTPGPATAAREVGVETLEAFFTAELAEQLRAEGRLADVIVANNVMAHVPDLNGFVAGFRTLIADDGLITIENPYVRDLIERREFDTIYHEHFCYFSCTAVVRLMRRHDLFVNDVDGSGLPDAGDEVHRVGWFLTDESHAQPGAVSEEEIEFGITLQQYWIGLIGLAGMIFVIVASFVYLKFVNPHNSGPKDR